MIEYIGWSCDYKKSSGEGQLARKFIKLKFKYKKIKVLAPKSNFFLSDYFYQIYGILILWYYYLNGKKVIYINYLPLWNLLIFLFSPPKTIFGPITGSLQINKPKNFKSLIRLLILPTIYKISLSVLNYRKKEIIFSTNILFNLISKNIRKKSKFNFVLDNFKLLRLKNKKKIDLIVYYNKHENKFFNHHFDLIKSKILKGKKVLIIGDKLIINGALNKGRVRKSNLVKYISQSKYTLSGDDNLLSFFNIECLQNNVKIICNYKLGFQIINKFKNSYILYDYENKRYK